VTEDILKKLYESEINFSIRSFWDCGYVIKLGDHLNGWLASEHVRNWDEIGPRLAELARTFYPEFAAQNPGPPAAIEGDPERIRRERQVPLDSVFADWPETMLDSFERHQDKAEAARTTVTRRRL
jgi:hypothetical protein